MGKLTETNRCTSKEKTNSFMTLYYYQKNTHFSYCNYVSFVFSLKYFEEKRLSRPPLYIYLPRKIIIDVRVTSA